MLKHRRIYFSFTKVDPETLSIIIEMITHNWKCTIRFKRKRQVQSEIHPSINNLCTRAGTICIPIITKCNVPTIFTTRRLCI